MIRRIGCIIGTVLILFLMVAFAGVAQDKIIRSPVVSTEKLEALKNLPDFQLKTTTKETNRYYYTVSTILTNSEPINQYIQMWVNKEIDQFLAYVEKNRKHYHEKHLAQLHISVEIELKDEIHSLTFFVINKETERQDAIQIFNLDLKNHKIISFTDVLGVDLANHEDFRTIIKEQSINEDERKLSKWLEKSIKEPNQLNWSINQSNFNIYLDDDNYNKVEIPLAALSPYLTEYIMNRLHITPPEELVRILDSSGKYIALTFDDGPSPSVTPQILETLRQHGAKATFFMLGSQVQYYPDTAKQVAEEGHEIGNHTSSHPNLSKLSEEQIQQEIVGASQVIEAVIGESPTFFRPPYGVYNPIVEKVAFEHNFPIILWSVDSLDWKDRNAEEVNRLVKETISPGSIVLLHDIHQSTADALPVLMAELRNEGYQFVTISELLSLQEINGIGPYYSVAY